MRVSGLLTIVCLLCQAAVTLAQGDVPVSPETRAEASAHFNRAVELFQEEAFRGALVEFQRAYEIAPDYRLLYNIGQTRLELQDYLGASKAYESYLSRGGTAIPAERRKQVEEALAAMKERIGRISISVNRDAAEVYVDEQIVGTSPLDQTVMVNVGSHRVSARTSDGASDARTVDVAGGDVAVVSLKLVAATPAVVYREAEDTSWSRKRRTGVGTWIAGGAMLIAGVATGIRAKSAQDDLDELLKTPEVNQAEVEDKRQQAHRLAITTDVLIATGAATAVAGTLLWVFGAKEKAPSEKKQEARSRWLHLNVGLTSLGVRGQF